MYNIKELLNHEPITPLSEVLLLSVSLEAAIKAFQGDLQEIYSTAGIDGKGEFLRKVSFGTYETDSVVFSIEGEITGFLMRGMNKSMGIILLVGSKKELKLIA